MKNLIKQKRFWNFKNFMFATDVPFYKSIHSEYVNMLNIGKARGLHKHLVSYHNEMGDVFWFWWNNLIFISVGHPKYWTYLKDLFDRPPELFEFVVPIISRDSIQHTHWQEAKKRLAQYYTPFLSRETIDKQHSKVILDVVKKYEIKTYEQHLNVKNNLNTHFNIFENSIYHYLKNRLMRQFQHR